MASQQHTAACILKNALAASVAYKFTDKTTWLQCSWRQALLPVHPARRSVFAQLHIKNCNHHTTQHWLLQQLFIDHDMRTTHHVPAPAVRQPQPICFSMRRSGRTVSL